jgi:transcriptional regulator with XRE-family HTH domain
MSYYADVKRPPALTSAQIRAARALIRWSAEELAKASEIGVSTIRRAELEPGETKLTRVNDQAIRRTLEGAGVLFIDADGGAGPGVRLQDPRHEERKIEEGKNAGVQI